MVNKTSYVVSITTVLDSLEFESIGILNTNTQTQRIFVTGSGLVDTTLLVGTCPQSTAGVLVLWLIVLIALALFVGAMLFNIPFLGILGSFALFTASWTLSGCQASFGFIVAGAGIFMFIAFVFKSWRNGVNFG